MIESGLAPTSRNDAAPVVPWRRTNRHLDVQATEEIWLCPLQAGHR